MDDAATLRGAVAGSDVVFAVTSCESSVCLSIYLADAVVEAQAQ